MLKYYKLNCFLISILELISWKLLKNTLQISHLLHWQRTVMNYIVLKQKCRKINNKFVKQETNIHGDQNDVTSITYLLINYFTSVYNVHSYVDLQTLLERNVGH